MTKKSAQQIPPARQTVPASAKRFETLSSASLSRSRKRIRWYGVGAIQERRAERGERQRGEVRVFLQVVDAPEGLRERRDQQEPEQHLHAGQRHAQLVEQLDQLAVEVLLIRLGHGGTLHGGEALDHPAVAVAAIAEAVVEPVRPVLPELPDVRHEAEAAPVLGPRRRVADDARERLERGSVGDDLALRRRRGAGPARRWSELPVRVGVGRGEPFDRTLHANLATGLGQ